MPDELQMEVHDIVQETGIKSIPKKKKCKKAKWLPEEALQIAVKSKGEKERYKYLSVEFQRIARRKCCTQYASKYGRQQWPQDWKRSVFIAIPKKGNAKECSIYHTIALISHASKVMLKILQARLQHYVNRELPDVQAGFRKGRGTRDQIANIRWIMEKAREFQKNIYFCFID